MSAPDPERIGPFAVVRRLGQGGMGVVYHVRDPDTGRDLALKRVLPSKASDAEAIERFWREARVLAQVRHAGVVRVHSVGQARDGSYLVLDLVEGQTLDELARAGPLEPRRAAELVAALADAVQAVHAAGVLHRDLKPQNVIVRPDGAPVLLDFGLARELDAASLTATGEAPGTLAYMSPEQARGGRRELDERSDVFALGVILHQLVAGRAPLQGSPVEVLRQLVEGREAPPPSRHRREVPRALDAIVGRALATARERRYPSAAALRDDLQRFLRGEPPLAAPRGKRRRTVLLLGGLALGVVALASHGAPPALEAPPSDGASPPRHAHVDAAALASARLVAAAEAEVARRPHDVNAWLERARTLARAGDLERALAAPPADAPAAARAAHGLALDLAGRRAAALETLEGVLQALPDDEQVFVGWLRSCFAMERPVKVADLDMRLFAHPDWLHLRFERGRLYGREDPELRTRDAALAAHLEGAVARREGRFEDALVALNQAVAGGRPSASLLVDRARTLSKLEGDPLDPRFVDDVERALRLEPLLVDVWALRASILAARGDADGAAAALLVQARLRGPERGAHPLVLRAELLTRAGRGPGVLDEVERQIERHDDTDAYVALGRMLEAIREVDRARRAYLRALAPDVGGAPQHAHEAARRLELLGAAPANWQEIVRRHFDRRIAARPQDPRAYALRCSFLSQIGRPREAIEDGRRAVALGGGGALAHVALGSALNHAGEPQAALEECRRALELDPALPLAHRLRADVLADLGDLPGALRSMDQAVTRLPTDPELRAARATYREQAGDLRGAAEDHQAAGNAKEAARCLERAAQAERAPPR